MGTVHKTQTIMWWRMLVALCLALVVAGGVSCTRTVYVPKTTKEVVIDTITEVRADSSVFNALLECDSTGNVLIKELSEAHGKMAAAELALKENRLVVETRWQTKYIDRYIEVRDTTTIIKEVEVIKEVKHIPTMYRYSLYIVIGCIAVGAISLARRFNIF